MNIFKQVHNYLPPHPELACLELAVAWVQDQSKAIEKKNCASHQDAYISKLEPFETNIAKNQIVTGCWAGTWQES